MRIKRVEIIGFKSFCDRAVLNIGTSLTGVVGPNGCGKSNIVDAIRWCMGEQSAKHLRGKAMDDVIFAGSESRGPAAMAEVSLTFEDVGFSHETLALALDAENEMKSPVAEDLEEVEGEAQAPGATDDSVLGAMPTTEAEAETLPQSADAGGEADHGNQEVAVADIHLADAAAPAGEILAEGNVEGEESITSATEDVARFLEDKPAAIDFGQYSEVQITRRLFRDGTSQYLLNKVPCRLRDVTDFFLGTGVGTKAYSIIEQGRVGQIVSSRPQDRRTIIEEAAGITKFKAKKKAAERKLDQTRQNLLRVSDIVTELDKRMGTLRRQAQKAERYRRYKSEVKDIELWKASHRFLEMRAEEQVVAARATELRDELQAARTGFDTQDASVIAERAELSIEERRLSALQETIYDFDNRIRLAESKLQFERREIAEIEERSSSGRHEIDSLTTRRSEAAGELERQSTELAELTELVASEESQVSERELAATEARQMLANAQSLLDEARANVSKARADLSRAEGQRENLARRHEEAANRLGRVVGETTVGNERARELDRELRRAEGSLAGLRQTRLDLGAQTENFESRRALLIEAEKNSEAEVETLRTELHRRKSRLHSLIEIQQKYEGFARGTRAVMQHSEQISAGNDEIRGLVADIVTAPESLEVAVEAALGDRLGGVLVATPHVGMQAIRYLKDAGAGRSAFVAFGAMQTADSAPAGVTYADGGPELGAASTYASAHASGDESMLADSGFDAPGALSWNTPATHAGSTGRIEVEDRVALNDAVIRSGGEGVLGRMVDLVSFNDGFEHVGGRLLGDCVVVDTLDRAIKMQAAGYQAMLVTLDGDLIDERGVVSGGSRESQGAGVLAQKREIRDLEEITASLDQDLADATARFVSTKSELTQVTRALESLRRETYEGDIAITGHEKDVSRCRGELDRLRERLTQLNAEQLELEARIEGITADQAAAEALAVSSADNIERFEREQLGHISGVTDGTERVETLAAALTDARIRAAQLGEKRASLSASALQLQVADRELGERIARLETAIAEGVERAATLAADCAEIDEALVGLRDSRRVDGEALETGRNAYEMRVAELQVAEMAVRELRTRAEKLSGELSSLDLRLANLEMNRKVLLDSIDERYHLRLPRVIGDYHLRPLPGDEEEKRLGELKGLIERMGADINLTAIEEFAEVSARHEFLAKQRDDLDNAVDQLAKAIDKINKTSRKMFKDTFTAVNETFKRVFPRLFRGGHASLSLTGGADADLLEAGVEIMAQPPGKKNVTVDQLSGGEKALTAVALIFSIFLIKPSPFCILDEVDAPLDEANVDRYNEIVREMTDRSQFIIITHNKRTMESTDNLYGVTMQEPGVSKLVSVNLSKASRAAA